MERPRLGQSFVTGSIQSVDGLVPVVPGGMSWRDRLGGYLVRWNIGRFRYTVDPGLYAVGAPGANAPVLVSANYKLSFDMLRRELSGRDAWILVLDTRGINVWCAAGKGTFGTEEVVERINRSGLGRVVSHRVIVLPQLGAPGVAAHEVKRRTGFRAVFGPVLAADLPGYLEAGAKATPEMRRVTFPVRARLVLVPVELTAVLGIALAILAANAVLMGLGPGLFSLGRALGAVLPSAIVVGTTMAAGAILTPLLLPWIPGRMFAVKGALVGAISAALVLPLIAGAFHPLRLVANALLIIAGASYIAMNFTGSSTFTSLSGVQREMRAALPWQMAGAALAVVLWIVRMFV